MNLFIQQAAEHDILDQFEWYTRKGLPQIARRFRVAALDAIDALVAMPTAGPPKVTRNPHLTGLRGWPEDGFNEFWVYYLVRADRLTVVRVLHSKRDTRSILGEQELEEP